MLTQAAKESKRNKHINNNIQNQNPDSLVHEGEMKFFVLSSLAFASAKSVLYTYPLQHKGVSPYTLCLSKQIIEL